MKMRKYRLYPHGQRMSLKKGTGTGVYMKPPATCVNMECPKIRRLKF